MSSKIKYTKAEYAPRPTFRTIKYGNMMCDTVQGEVNQSDSGEWSGWFTNHSNSSRSEFKLGFGNKGAATRWVNAQLKSFGVK